MVDKNEMIETILRESSGEKQREYASKLIENKKYDKKTLF